MQQEISVSYYSHKLVDISNTLRVISECWSGAEDDLRAEIQKYHPYAGETFITELFHGKLARRLEEASDGERISSAFLRDLEEEFYQMQGASELRKISEHLIAHVSLHKPATEGKTGGDMGVLIARPQIIDRETEFKIKDYRTGLLCQAKLRNAKGKWGTFTASQRKVLPDKLDYTGLLLYSYDHNSGGVLNTFQWRLCKNTTLQEIATELKKGVLTDLYSSEDIIFGLGNGRIGTSDNTILDRDVSPARNPVLTIHITWPDDKRPGGASLSVPIESPMRRRKIKEEVKIHLLN
jgi:hypothetical protein